MSSYTLILRVGFIEYYNYSFDEIIGFIQNDDSIQPDHILRKYSAQKVIGEFQKRKVKDFKYLLKRIRKGDAIRYYAGELGVPEEYLQQLHRYLRTLVPKAKPLKNLGVFRSNFIDKKTTELYLKTLKFMGISNTFHILHAGRTIQRQKGIQRVSGIPIDFLQEIIKYSDLDRCSQMNSKLISVLIDLKIDTSQKLANLNKDQIVRLTEQIKNENSLIPKIKKKIDVSYIENLCQAAKLAINRFSIEYSK